MKSLIRLIPCCVFLLAGGIVGWIVQPTPAGQLIQLRGDIVPVDIVPVGNVQQDEADAKDEKKEKKPDEGPVTDTANIGQNPSPLAEKFIRFHMWDGSIVGGEVTTNEIEVQTEFGTLRIPIQKISRFHPGLNSIPVLNKKLSGLVAGLGDKDFDVRESSHRELVAMGIMIRNAINEFEDGGSAERKKRLDEVRKAIDDLYDEINEFDEQSEIPIVRGDTIVTKDFTIVGKILQSEFRLASKFGELSVDLGDIKMADRSFNESKPDIRKTLELQGTAFFQSQPKSTRIRVNRGDKVFVSASGVVQWTNWSTSSGPDGINSQGQWQGMDCGTLAARIGDTAKYIKLGSKGEFTAKQSGELFLGVAMRDNYANNNGYRWDGKYDVKIVVKPAEKK